MFKYSIDSKEVYTNDEGVEMVDLTRGIFKSTADYPTISSIYRVNTEYNMRPDLVSMATYGNTDYTEFVLKYSDIPNPFAITKDDIVVIATINTVEIPVETIDRNIATSNNTNTIKKYHKYIDPTKVPDSNSEKNNVTTEGDKEANLSYERTSGITVKDGKIFFGDTASSDVPESPSVDSSLVSCAKNGVTLGQFLRATLKNENK